MIRVLDMQTIDVVWDMETSDPDDFLTLLLLIGHPRVNLKAVTVTPGTPEQIGLVRHAVNDWFNLNIPVGAYNIQHEKQCVSAWHYKVYGYIPPNYDAELGYKVLQEYCDENTTLITGAPLKNLGAAITESNGCGNTFKLGRLVAQGGFAGKDVVPIEWQLEKFKGMITCPSYNLNGDIKSALAALEYPQIGIKRFVSKNVCHQVYYNQQMHERLGAIKDKSLALFYIWKGMDVYLKKNPAGKKFHDPLAACCAIDESIGTWEEVKMYYQDNKWGAFLSQGSKTWIITNYNHEKFVQTLTAV